MPITVTRVLEMRTLLEGTDVLDHLLSDVRVLRRRTADLVDNQGTVDQIFANFCDLWSRLSANPQQSEWYVPPLYLNEQTRSTMHLLVGKLLVRERGGIRFGISQNAGHTVFGGVHGTGKSTLLRAVALAVMFLFKRMLPVCLRYSAASCELPITAICRAAPELRIHLEAASTLESILSRLEPVHSALLVVDELQSIFSTEDSAPIDLPTRLRAAAQIAEVSRFGNSYVLIAGSSVDMRSVMFRSGTMLNPDAYRRIGYPDCNGSLYKLLTIPAHRTAAELDVFTKHRYPNWALTSEDVKELLYNTGGIGKFVNKAFEATGADNDHAVVVGLSSAMTQLKDKLNADGRRGMPSEAYLTDPYLQLIATLITNQHNEAVEADAAEPRHALECIGASIVTIRSMLRKIFPDCDTEGVINRLVDQSLLYTSKDRTRIELTRPVDAHIYTSQEHHTLHEKMLYVTVLFMLNGIQGDYGPISYLSAGKALQALVRPYIRRSFPASMHPAIWSGTQLRIEGARLQVLNNGTGDWQPLTLSSLEAIQGQLLECKGERGLDGVVFTYTPAEGWCMHGWQCKGGQIEATIDGGKMDTSIDIYKEEGTVANINDSTYHGILLKAQVGFCRIISAWHNTIPTVPVLPASLVITTTKVADLAKKSITRDFGKGMMIAREVGEVTLGPVATWPPGIANAKIFVHVYDRLQWLEDCLPSTLTESLPLPKSEPEKSCVIM